MKNPGSQKPVRTGIDSPVPMSDWGGEKVVCPRCKEENPLQVDACGRCGFSFSETRAGNGPGAPAASNLIGKVINGKYRVLSVLGEGGFGIVYKVELLLFDTGNIFALKLLHPSLSKDRTFRRRFLREAGLAMALIHENTIQIREFGQTDDGQLFFTMDYCEGEPLKSVILRERFLTVNRALHVVRQILSVMRLAHARGIIHRDLKPENIFLERDAQGRDFVKVGDFGLAKSFCPGEELAQGRPVVQGRPIAGSPASHGDDITRGGIVGTPRYMSPEQAIGKEDVDDRSDLYSIGVVLYEMLYGQAPPEKRAGDGASDTSLKTPACGSPHPVPRAVWELVRKATEWERDDRYQSADEFLEAIDALPQYTPTYAEPAPRSRTLTSWAPIVSVVLILGALGLGAYYWPEWMQRGASEGGQGVKALMPMRVPPGQGAAPHQADSTAMPQGERSERAETRGSGSEVDATKRKAAPRTSMLAPTSPGGIRAFVSFGKGDVLRYQTYREGMIPDREIVYEIVDEPVPGQQFTVKTSPGDRTFTWVVDEKESAFYQEFQLPDRETGVLQEKRERRLKLRLPSSSTVVDGDYIEGDLKMHAKPVDLPVPGHPKYNVFTECLCAESREGSRISCQYYQEGRGLVALIVYEPRTRGTPSDKRLSPDAKANGKEGQTLPTPPSPPPFEAQEGTPSTPSDYQVVYARYLVEHVARAKGK